MISFLKLTPTFTDFSPNNIPPKTPQLKHPASVKSFLFRRPPAYSKVYHLPWSHQNKGSRVTEILHTTRAPRGLTQNKRGVGFQVQPNGSGAPHARLTYNTTRMSKVSTLSSFRNPKSSIYLYKNENKQSYCRMYREVFVVKILHGSHDICCMNDESQWRWNIYAYISQGEEWLCEGIKCGPRCCGDLSSWGN